MNALRLGLALVSLAGLSACVESDTSGAPSAALRMAPASDESACLGAVAAQTNNSVTVLSSETSEANNMVMVGVGPDRAPWKCLINGGKVVEVMSMTNEGTL